MDPDPNDKKKVIKVKVNDKRRAAQEPPATDDVPTGSPLRSGAEEAAAAADSSSTSRPTGSSPSSAVADVPTDDGPASAAEAERDYLDDLRRLQADFDNYRKRMMRDQASVGQRATGRLIEGLLPVLDNFERAIAHGEGGEGVQMVFKDLKAALEHEGLEEVPGEGVEFDPNVHEAVESREVEGLEQPTVIEVYRRGYMHKGQLLRAAMVVVGRPREEADAGEANEGSEE